MANKKGLPACRQAIVLLSGGLDSATTLFLARDLGFQCSCLIFDYGQRHKKEIESAKKIARIAHSPYKIVKLDFPWKGSALLDKKIKIPQYARIQGRKNTISSTYVPARNIIFLSLALSFAEAVKAEAIFIGANAVDFSGYPDCRPLFFKAFKKAADSGTKAGIEDKKIRIATPLIKKTKAEIIKTGKRLGVPFGLTWSCYAGGNKPCGRCDSCYFRAKGFKEAGVKDPLLAHSV